MKLSRHARRKEGNYLSPFIIIQLPGDVSFDDLSYVSQIFMDENNPPEYCVFVGLYNHIYEIVKTIQEKYTIVWISDYYCMASCKPAIQYIPEAEVKIYKNAFSINLRDISVLITPELGTFNEVIMSCKSNNLGFCMVIHLFPMFGILCPCPGNGIIFEAEYHKKIVFNELFIPFFAIEHLQHCFLLA